MTDDLKVLIDRTIADSRRFLSDREDHLIRKRKSRESSLSTKKMAQMKSDKARFYMSMTGHNAFGSDAPCWTIPSSRKDIRPIDQTPPPGNYDIPSLGVEHRGFTFTKAKSPPQKETNTCEVMITHIFPESSRPMSQTIGRISENDHFYLPMPTSPPPSYMPRPFGGSRAASIGSRYTARSMDASPGPARYEPLDTIRKKTIPTAVPRAARRSFVEDYMNDNPGPGSYDVIPPVQRAPKWTNRARERSKKFKKAYENHYRPWAVKKEANDKSPQPLRSCLKESKH